LTPFFHKRYFVRTFSLTYFPHLVTQETLWDFAAWLLFHTIYSVRFYCLTTFDHTNNYVSLIAWLLSFTQDTMWDLIAYCLFYTSYSVIFNRVTPFHHTNGNMNLAASLFSYTQENFLELAAWLLFLKQDTLWDLAAGLYISHKILHFIFSLTPLSLTRY
jgi:hypothetical protein